MIPRIFLLVGTLLLGAGVYAQVDNKNILQYSASRLIVKFRDHVPLEQGRPGEVSIAGAGGARQAEPFRGKPVKQIVKSNPRKQKERPLNDLPFLIELDDDDDADQAIETLMATGLYEYVEKDAVNFALEDGLVPDDARYNTQQWYLHNDGTYEPGSKPGADIDIQRGWLIATGSPSVTVAIIDSGLDMDHPEFTGRIWSHPGETAGDDIDNDNNGYVDDVQGYDFKNNDNNPEDDYGHGTHVTGLAGATGNNGNMYAGVDWNCKLMVLKCLGADGLGSTADIIEAVYYAVDNGADVINMSVGGDSYLSVYNTAIEYAKENDVIVVAAMGNSNSEAPVYPAAYPGSIAVGAAGSSGIRWGSGNYGNHIWLSAPGKSIYSLSISGDDGIKLNGTSMATPLVAGVVSLMKSIAPELSVDSVKTILRLAAVDQVGHESEDTPGWDKYHGHGWLSAYNSLRYLVSTDTILYAATCDSYDFNGEILTVQGTYYDTLQNGMGMDSIVTLHLTVHPVYEQNEAVTAAHSYEFGGATYTESGLYDHLFLTVNGCDSLVHLDLTIVDPAGENCAEAVEIVSPGVFQVDNTFGSQWFTYTAPAEGQVIVTTCNLTASDTYINLYLDSNDGCTLTLIDDSDDDCNFQSELAVTAAAGDVLRIEFTNKWTSNVYDAELKFYEPVENTDCANATWVQSGVHRANTVLAAEQWFAYRMPADGSVTVSSCSTTSIDTHLEVYDQCGGTAEVHSDDCNTQESFIFPDRTEGEQFFFVWRNTYEAALFEFEVTFTPAEGDYCDNYDNDSTVNIAAYDEYVFNGATLTESGIYAATFTSSHECDSLVTLNLTVTPTPGSVCSAPIAVSNHTAVPVNNEAGDRFYQYAAADAGLLTLSTCGLTSENTKILVYRHNGSGPYCDQWAASPTESDNCGLQSEILMDVAAGEKLLIRMSSENTSGQYNLRIDQCAHEESTKSVEVCDSYQFGEDKLISSGTYIKTFQKADGCDSLVTLNLTILESTEALFAESACDSYTFLGETYTSSGIYNGTLTNAAGCDSLVTLNLTILKSTEALFTESACDSYTFLGETYTASGNYNVTLANAAGCDSLVTLALTIRDEDDPACTVTDVDDRDIEHGIKAYPNPTGGSLTIDLGEVHTNVRVELLSVTGHIITSAQYAQTQIIKTDLDAAGGLYIIRLSADRLPPRRLQVSKY